MEEPNDFAGGLINYPTPGRVGGLFAFGIRMATVFYRTSRWPLPVDKEVSGYCLQAGVLWLLITVA